VLLCPKRDALSRLPRLGLALFFLVVRDGDLGLGQAHALE
jgi:hypothetical protein